MQLQMGGVVLAYNESNSQNGYYPITAVHRNMDPKLTSLWVKSNTGIQELIQTTPEHPFYLAGNIDDSTRPQPEGHADLNSNWVGAGHLKVGDKVKQADGSVGTVANVVTYQQTREMFNLTVETAHTYYVGQTGWLVHNCEEDDFAKLLGDYLPEAAKPRTSTSHPPFTGSDMTSIRQAAMNGQLRFSSDGHFAERIGQRSAGYSLQEVEAAIAQSRSGLYQPGGVVGGNFQHEGYLISISLGNKSYGVKLVLENNQYTLKTLGSCGVPGS